MSLAYKYLEEKATTSDDTSDLSDINFRGIGIGNGFISATDQSLFADHFNSLGFISPKQYDMLRVFDNQVLKAYEDGNFSAAILHSQAALHIFATEIMSFTNIYDHTFDGNYLTNHEYVCFLQQDHVRKGIHVGDASFNNGYASYTFLNESVMVSKKEWLNEVLQKGLEVMIYNGNLDVIVHVPGMNKVVNSLEWDGRDEFRGSEQGQFWIWNEDTGDGELAGYVTAGGNLTYVIVRKAGHMVPISQPRWAEKLVNEFTGGKPKGKRFGKPKEIRKKVDTAFKEC